MKRFLMLLVSVVVTGSLLAQTADEIIAKHIDSTGGADAWRKVNSVVTEGTVQVQGSEVSLVQTILHGKGVRQDISVMGMNGFTTLTPTAGWIYMPFQGQQAPEPRTAEDVAESQDELDAQGALVDYAAKGHTVEYIGTDDVEGTECFKIKLNKKGGTSETIFIDTKTYFLIRDVSIRKADGQQIEVTSTYSNFEKLPEGIVVAKSITLPFGELVISKYSINAPVEESIFSNSK